MAKIVKTNLEIQDWFDKLQDKVDMWITDPPYPFENKNGSGRFDHVQGVDHMYDRLDWDDLQVVFEQMYTETNPGGRAYVFCNRDGLFDTKKRLEKAGWKFRNIIVWDKQAMGMGYHWRNQVEYIVYVTKGSVSKYVKSAPNIFYHKKPRAKDSIPSIGYHPTGTSPKPYQIWETIMLNQLSEGEIVADPFAGSEPLRVAVEINSNIKSLIKKAYVNSF